MLTTEERPMLADSISNRLYAAVWSTPERGRATLRIEHRPTGITAQTAQRPGEPLLTTKARCLGILRGKVAVAGQA